MNDETAKILKASKQWNLIFRCRLCGKTEMRVVINDAFEQFSRLFLGKVSDTAPLPIMETIAVHTCKDGNVGVLDLAGAAPKV